MSNILIISPHPDDEVLGASSFLKGATVLYMTTKHPLVFNEDNVSEAMRLSRHLGFKIEFIKEYTECTNNLGCIPPSDVIRRIELAINVCKPHTVLITNPSYNQDHRVIYDAALTAMRHHDKNHFVKRILLYEQPETFDTMRKPEPFRANYFKPIDIREKIDAIQVYQTQLRGHRSPDYIRAIAKVRGQQANVEWAEAFEVVRWVE